jgi:hypothetical protein
LLKLDITLPYIEVRARIQKTKILWHLTGASRCPAKPLAQIGVSPWHIVALRGLYQFSQQEWLEKSIYDQYRMPKNWNLGGAGTCRHLVPKCRCAKRILLTNAESTLILTVTTFSTSHRRTTKVTGTMTLLEIQMKRSNHTKVQPTALKPIRTMVETNMLPLAFRNDRR